MVSLINILYHGEVDIEYWEWVLGFLYVVMFYVYLARKKRIKVKTAPEYKYFIWAGMVKILGGIGFCLIYFYYYQGGDSMAYFYSGVAMRNLAFEKPLEFFSQLAGSNEKSDWFEYNGHTAKPFQFIFFDDRTFAVVRLMSLFAIATFKSYLLSTMLMASASFLGVWACYRTFVSYFPQLSGSMAIGFLFMPSSVFWGSAILKDTITFCAVCWWVHASDEVFFKKRAVLWKSVVMFLSALAMLMVKPYIFMPLLSATLLWLFYFRVVAIRNALLKFVLFPFAMALFGGGTLFVLNKMGDSLGRFALDGVLENIEVTQKDLLRADSYGSNSFDIGELDGTWLGLLSKFPVAVNAVFFRPYIWESRTFTMALSGLENTWVLLLVLFTVLRSGPVFIVRCMTGVPLLLMSMVFALLFGFAVGVSTPNFGALVRFKIPLIPFLICSMYIINYLGGVKQVFKAQKQKFDLKEFRMGTPHVGDTVELVKARRRQRRLRHFATKVE